MRPELFLLQSDHHFGETKRRDENIEPVQSAKFPSRSGLLHNSQQSTLTVSTDFAERSSYLTFFVF
jgi:hypothetical protein